MTEAELKTLLEQSGYPVAYHQFKTPPAPPYLIYLLTGTDNMGADNRVYHQDPSYQVELYTLVKDPAAEQEVETLLDSQDVYWEKSETYIQSEKLYQVVYEI